MRLFGPSLLLVFGVACASRPPPAAEPPAPAKRPPRRPGFGGGGAAGKAELQAAIEAAKRNELDTTITQCRAAIAKNPNLEQAYLLLGSACSLKDDAACERAAYDKGIEALPTSVALRSEAGFLALQEGRNDDAKVQYARARELTGGKNAEITAHLAYAKGLSGELPAAVALAREAAEFDDRCARCATIYGRLLLASGERDAAIASLERAHELDAEDVDASSQLAKAYFLAKRTDDAAKLYGELVTATEDAGLRSEYTLVLMKAERYDEAIAQLEVLTAMYPKERSLWARLHEAQKKAGRSKDARATKKKLEGMK